jgi:hypothetical protein
LTQTAVPSEIEAVEFSGEHGLPRTTFEDPLEPGFDDPDPEFELPPAEPLAPPGPEQKVK